jgi:hypothetical protein
VFGMMMINYMAKIDHSQNHYDQNRS